MTTSLALIAIIVFAGAVTFLADRGARRGTRAAAMLGLVYGIWLLAPRLLSLHHIAPRTLGHWLVLDVFFAVTFAAIGAAFGLMASLPIAAARVAVGAPENRSWADIAWPMAWLPVLYLGTSVAVEWTAFNRFVLPMYPGEVVAFLVGHSVLAAVVLVFLARRPADRDAPLLLRSLAAIAALGFVALVFRAPEVTYAASTAAPLVRDPALTAHRPVLFVGLDAATWRALRPLMDRGRMPTFARLAREGVTGEMMPAWGPPFWSAQAWASIMTGYERGDTGVNEDLAARASGLPPFEMPLTLDTLMNPIYAIEYRLVGLGWIEVEPTERSGLKRVPVWERLSQAGVRTAVVRFPFTYPAGMQADYVVSNRLVNDLWDMIGVHTGEPGFLVYPPESGSRWLANFSDTSGRAAREFPNVVTHPDWPQPADLSVNPIDAARRAVTVQQQMHDTALDIVSHDPSIEVFMIYIPGFDNIAHAFWQYRFPGDYPAAPPAPADIAALGPVVDRYLELLDRQLAELIAAFPAPPDVVVVSDHGMGPIQETTLWRGWHAARGIFLASGTGVPHGVFDRPVTYFDVVPTLLHRLGFHVPNDMTGTPLLQ